MAIQCPGPIMIIKRPVNRYEHPAGYTMAGLSDGSKSSLKGVELMCTLAQKGDKITVITCQQENIDTDKISQDCLEIVKKHGIDEDGFKLEVIKKEFNKMTKDLIHEKLMGPDYIQCDFIFVGNRGADFLGEGNELGSVSGEIIKKCKLNTVFIPNVY